METEKELNKALSDIYSDLEKLQSAREQIEIVTESSNELTNSTSNLLKELKKFSNQILKEKSTNISQLTESLNDFENKINKISEKGNQSISEYIDSFKKQIVNVIEQFSNHIATNEKNLNAISNLTNEKIGVKIKEFENATKDLKINTEKSIEEIKTEAINKIEIQEQIISKTIAKIEDTNLKNIELISIITKYDIPKRLEDIDKKLAIQINQGNLNKKLLIIILSFFGFIGLIALFILYKVVWKL